VPVGDDWQLLDLERNRLDSVLGKGGAVSQHDRDRLQIADELAAAALKAQILDPLDRAADIPVRPDHGLLSFR
jgi:hypothetical protein